MIKKVCSFYVCLFLNSYASNLEKNPLDVVTTIKPIQAIITGYLESYNRVLEKQVHKKYINCIAFSPNGAYFASGAADGSINIAETKTGKSITTISQTAWIFGEKRNCLSLVWTPDNEHVIVVIARESPTTFGENIEIWHHATGKFVKQIDRYGTVKNIVYTPDNKYLISVAIEYIVVLDRISFKRKHVIENEQNWGVAISPDSKYLATTSTDMAHVNIFSIKTGKLKKSLRHKDANGPLSFAYSPDGKKLISLGTDSLKCWDTKTFKTLHEKMFSNTYGYRVAYSPNNSCFAVCRLAELILWDSEDIAMQVDLNLEREKTFSAIAFSPDGKFFIGGAHDGSVVIWKFCAKELELREESSNRASVKRKSICQNNCIIS